MDRCQCRTGRSSSVSVAGGRDRGRGTSRADSGSRGRCEGGGGCEGQRLKVGTRRVVSNWVEQCLNLINVVDQTHQNIKETTSIPHKNTHTKTYVNPTHLHPHQSPALSFSCAHSDPSWANCVFFGTAPPSCGRRCTRRRSLSAESPCRRRSTGQRGSRASRGRPRSGPWQCCIEEREKMKNVETHVMIDLKSRKYTLLPNNSSDSNLV